MPPICFRCVLTIWMTLKTNYCPLHVLDVVMGRQTIRHIELNKTLTSFYLSLPNLPSKTIKVGQTPINIINEPLLPANIK